MSDSAILNQLEQQQRLFYESVVAVLQLNLEEDIPYGQTVVEILAVLPERMFIEQVVKFLAPLSKVGSLNGDYWRTKLYIGLTCHQDYRPERK